MKTESALCVLFTYNGFLQGEEVTISNYRKNRRRNVTTFSTLPIIIMQWQILVMV